MGNRETAAGFVVILILAMAAPASAQRECGSGYEWSRRVVACVQSNCGDVQHAHYAYGGGCVCGSSGSIHERPTDPNRECRHGSNHATCPNCVYACVGLNDACPAEPGAPPRECNLDQEMLDLERESEALHQRGERLRRLMQIDLPTFPQLDYCVRASGSSITVNISDGSSRAQQIVNLIGSFETAVDAVGAFADGGPATLRGSLRNLSVGVLRSLRGQVIEARTRSRGGNDPALEFIRDTQQMAQNVEDVRHRMVCAVRTGVPEFYRQAQALERTVTALERRIAENPACAQGLTRLIAVKMRDLRRIYRWHAEGIMRPPGASTRTGRVNRRTWLDARVDARQQPLIFTEHRCP